MQVEIAASGRKPEWIRC